MILTKEQIDKCFEDVEHQADYIANIYKLVYPDWDNIKFIDGWPTAGKELHEYIFKKAISFDKEHHPNVINGGAWLNSGFSSLEAERLGLGPWELDKSTSEVFYFEEDPYANPER